MTNLGLQDLADTYDPDAVANWMAENWENVVIFVVVGVVLIVLLKGFHHHIKDFLVMCYHKARTMCGKSDVEDVKSDVEDGKSDVEDGSASTNPKPKKDDVLKGKDGDDGATVLTTQMRNRMRKVIRKEEQLMRLKAFFPKAEEKDIKVAQNRHTAEKDMVKQLLQGDEELIIPTEGKALLDNEELQNPPKGEALPEGDVGHVLMRARSSTRV